MIEDDPFVRGYAVGTLESLGYRVITAADGREGLAKLNQYADEIDVLFSDIVMPGGFGRMGTGGAGAGAKTQPEDPAYIRLPAGYDEHELSSEYEVSNSPQTPYRKNDLARRLRMKFWTSSASGPGG